MVLLDILLLFLSSTTLSCIDSNPLGTYSLSSGSPARTRKSDAGPLRSFFFSFLCAMSKERGLDDRIETEDDNDPDARSVDKVMNK